MLGQRIEESKMARLTACESSRGESDGHGSAVVKIDCGESVGRTRRREGVVKVRRRTILELTMRVPLAELACMWVVSEMMHLAALR
jgi:hypothetical protein